MAVLNAIAREWADELREGIAWVIVWKTGRSWNAQAVWLNRDDETFEPEDLELARKVLEQDPNAVMLNGYYCGHFGEDMNVAELAAGIRWHYENGFNQLDGSTAFPPEPQPRPEDIGGENVSKPYRTCPNCGSNLDHGERCDCQDRKERETAQRAADPAHKPATADDLQPVLTYVA